MPWFLSVDLPYMPPRGNASIAAWTAAVLVAAAEALTEMLLASLAAALLSATTWAAC